MYAQFSLPHCHHYGPQGNDPYPAEGSAGCPDVKASPACPKQCDSTAAAPFSNFHQYRYNFNGYVVTYDDHADTIAQAIMEGGPVTTSCVQPCANVHTCTPVHCSGARVLPERMSSSRALYRLHPPFPVPPLPLPLPLSLSLSLSSLLALPPWYCIACSSSSSSCVHANQPLLPPSGTMSTRTLLTTSVVCTCNHRKSRKGVTLSRLLAGVLTTA